MKSKSMAAIPAKLKPSPYFRRINAGDFNSFDPAFLAVDDLDLRFPAIEELEKKPHKGGVRLAVLSRRLDLHPNFVG